MVEEQPFSGISDEAHRKNIDVMAKSDIIVISNVPIGSGNLKNLEGARQGLDGGQELSIT